MPQISAPELDDLRALLVGSSRKAGVHNVGKIVFDVQAVAGRNQQHILHGRKYYFARDERINLETERTRGVDG